VHDVSRRYGLAEQCPIIAFADQPGVCNRCGSRLSGRRTQWCSRECETEFRQNHDWNLARRAARKRDGNRCIRCKSDGIPMIFIGQPAGPPEVRPMGWNQGANRLLGLEVNHVTPRVGGGYGWGCHHHLDGLETLCVPCHRVETNKQAAQRRARRSA
jgi:5-methylcytosine-specific restriction endonuclease McrA